MGHFFTGCLNMAITKLQAVNLMLDAIGEKPVSSLTSGLADAEQAERMFDRVNTDVQSVGWNVNRDRKFELTRDADNKFPLPITTLSVDTVDEHKHIKVANRNNYLYDVKNQTLIWSAVANNDHANLYVDIIQEQDFTELPYTLQRYIVARSAREFQESVMKSISLDSFAMRKEQQAYASLLQDEAEKEDANILIDNDYAYKVTRRRNNRLYGL